MWHQTKGPEATPEAMVGVLRNMQERGERVHHLVKLIGGGWNEEAGGGEQAKNPSEERFAEQIEELILKLDKPDIYQQITETFGTTSVGEALQLSDDVGRTALLMLLNILLPSMSSKLQSMTRTPLDTFRSAEEVLVYLDALIKSGVSTDANRETVYALGNTNVGKSSLVLTLKRFIENPNDKPKSVLTESNPKKLNTRIAEIYKDIAIDVGKLHDIKLKTVDKLTTIQIKEEDTNQIEKTLLNVIDYGGHKEYIICSKLFLKKNGIYLLCFEGASMKSIEDVKARNRHVC